MSSKELLKTYKENKNNYIVFTTEEVFSVTNNFKKFSIC